VLVGDMIDPPHSPDLAPMLVVDGDPLSVASLRRRRPVLPSRKHRGRGLVLPPPPGHTVSIQQDLCPRSTNCLNRCGSPRRSHHACSRPTLIGGPITAGVGPTTTRPGWCSTFSREFGKQAARVGGVSGRGAGFQVEVSPGAAPQRPAACASIQPKNAATGVRA
jgi:hypothetical protein